VKKFAFFALLVSVALARPVTQDEAVTVAGQFVASVRGPSRAGEVFPYADVAGEPAVFSCERVLSDGSSITVMVGARTDMPPTLLYYTGRPLEVSLAKPAGDAASRALGTDAALPVSRVYYSPLDFWFEYRAGSRTVMVDPRSGRPFDPSEIRSVAPAAYRAEDARRFEADWRAYFAGTAPSATDGFYWISGVPDWDWHYGCGPTAAANVLDYWNSRGYPKLVDSVMHGMWDPLEGEFDDVPNVSLQLAIAMHTDTLTGGTWSDSMVPGIVAVCDSATWNNGYRFSSDEVREDRELMVSEINADRPGVLMLIGHPVYGNHFVTFCGWGPPTDHWFMIHDEWSSTPQDVMLDYDACPAPRGVYPIVPGGAAAPDVGVGAIVEPDVAVPPGTVSPKTEVLNYGSSTDQCSAFCYIERPAGGFYEQFDSPTFPPAGWVEAHPFPDGQTYNWHLNNTDNWAECLREASFLPNNDWLITPKVRVRALDTLRFWYKSLGTGTYPESVEVWVSYTDANPASFIDCIQAFDFTATTFQPGWADFHSVGDTLVYIGLRYGIKAGMNAVGIALDDIQLKTVYYADTELVTLAPGEKRDVAFAPWNAAEGHYTVRGRIFQPGDANPANDERTRDFVASREYLPPSDWTEMTPMPAEPSMFYVKDGGSLGNMPAKGLIFASKGNKTRDFYSYNRLAGTWTNLLPVPEGLSFKPVKKGGRIVADSNRYVYMTKGNNTREFYRFDSDSTRWQTLESIPAGLRGRRIKGGNDLAYVPRPGGDQLYLLKGYDTEFYKYDVNTGKWTTLDPAPFSGKPKYVEGSFLVYDGDRTIYCHQAKYVRGMNHPMFKYDVVRDSWSVDTLAGMPVLGKQGGRIKSRKSKDGGCGAWFGGNLYALKGAATGQFFSYEPAKDSWTELDTMPAWGNAQKKRYVKNGADIANAGNAFYALKGNKTRELWRYVVPTRDALRPTPYARSGVMASPSSISELRFAIAPNPTAGGFTTLRYSLPKPGPVTLTVFDVAGRSVFRQSAICNLQSSMALDLRGLSAGVYLVRLDAGGQSASRKLIVQK